MKYQIHLWFLLLVVSGVISEPRNEYCDIQQCPNGTHTLCLYPNAGPFKEKCFDVIDRAFDIDEKTTVLDVFDKLQWDSELARIAQRWADQCDFQSASCCHLPELYVRQRYATFEAPPVSSDDESDEPFSPADLLYYDLLRKWKKQDAIYLEYDKRVGCGKIKISYMNTIYRLGLVCNFGSPIAKGWSVCTNA